MKKNPLLLLVALFSNATAQALPLNVDTRIEAVMPKVVEWRRDFHQHPELSNQ
jgi:amidohydrolase